MARLIISDGASERTMELTEPVTTFGRAPENQVMVADKECSRRHFQIERTEQGFKLVDLESRNGTKVNDRVVNQHLLSPGDRIQIGATTFTFQHDPAPAPAATLASPPPPPKEPEIRRRGGSTTTVEKIRVMQRARPGVGTRESSGAVKVVAVGAGILLGIVAILILVSAMTRETPQEREAREWLAQAEAKRSSDPKGAAELLRRVPASQKKYHDRAQQLLKELEGAAARSETTEDKEEADLFDTLYELQRNLDAAYVRILERCAEYDARFPKGRHASDVAKIRKAAEDKAAEIESRRGSDLARSLDEMVRGKRYAEALRAVNDALQNKDLAKHYAEYRERKNAILTEGKEYYNRQIGAGEDLVKNGKKPEARALFVDLEKTLAGVPEFSAQFQAVETWLKSLGS